MSANELADELMQVHNGHSDEGATTFSDAAELLRTQAARIAELEGDAAWQPIETATKGCSILCGTAGVKYSVAEAFFHSGAWRCWDGINNTRTCMVSPTHWKPIPKEPTIDAAIAGE